MATGSAVVVTSGFEVVPPAGGHEVGRRVVGEPAPPGGVQLLEDLDSFEQAGGLRPAGEGNGSQHAGRESPQMGVAGLEQFQVAGVALGALGRREPGLAQGLHADLPLQQASDRLVGHRSVAEDCQQLIEEHLAMLGGPSPLHQPLVELVAGTGVGARQRLVEQQHQLVEDFHGGLRQGGQQHRVSALGVGTGQGLGGGASPDLSQEPPSPRR